MGFIELLLIALGLSMDAFAVSVCRGLGMPRLNIQQAFVIAFFFGAFQALMPSVGWFFGSKLQSIVDPIDHWIAFLLLVFIGAKMLFDSFHGKENNGIESSALKLNLKELIVLAVATSIDALAVGISFAFLGINLLPMAAFIGITTFIISFAGVAIGHFFGSRYERPASIAGGIVLILIGFKILLEHLCLIHF